MPPCVFCVVCCAFVRCALCLLLVCNVLVLVVMCHADPLLSPPPFLLPTHTHTPPSLRVYVRNALSPPPLLPPPCAHSKRTRVYRHHARKCYHMRACCRYTRGRFECTHGGFQRATPHHTHTPRPQRHTRHTRTTTTDIARETGTRQEDRDKREDETRRQEKMKEERQDKTREETYQRPETRSR